MAAAAERLAAAEAGQQAAAAAAEAAEADRRAREADAAQRVADAEASRHESRIYPRLCFSFLALCPTNPASKSLLHLWVATACNVGSACYNVTRSLLLRELTRSPCVSRSLCAADAAMLQKVAPRPATHAPGPAESSSARFFAAEVFT